LNGATQGTVDLVRFLPVTTTEDVIDAHDWRRREGPQLDETCRREVAVEGEGVAPPATNADSGSSSRAGTGSSGWL